MSKLDVSLLNYPLPPPWTKRIDKEGGIIYINDITGKESIEHPAASLFSTHFSSTAPQPTPGSPGSTIQKEQAEEGDNQNGKLTNDNLSDVNSPEMDVIWFEGVEKRPDTLPNNNDSCGSATVPTHNSKKKSTGAFFDYRCEWKDTGLFGERNAYGLTVRYFDDDGRTTIRFDGVDGAWHFSILEGARGPVERYDLFVGARIKVFGRSLTITSTTASNCAWIEAEGAKLYKRQDWLREKIESVGAVPIVRKPIVAAIKNVTRSAKPAGQVNLRKIYDENAQLCEQLLQLGLGHFLSNESLKSKSINKL